jgi:hypothetical protein
MEGRTDRGKTVYQGGGGINIVFDDHYCLNKQICVNYKIRMDTDRVDNTKQVTDRY